jgi:F-type H+-transporting ATPase subunit b
LIARFIAPRLEGILGRRRLTIATDLSRAGELQKEAEFASEAYEKALTSARAQSQSMAQETRDRLSKDSDQLRKTMEADLNKKIADAENSITKARQSAMAHVDEIAALSVISIIETLTGHAPSADKAAQAVSSTKI